MDEMNKNVEVEENVTENVGTPEVKKPFWKSKGVKIAGAAIAGIGAVGAFAWGIIRHKSGKGSGSGDIDVDVEDLNI